MKKPNKLKLKAAGTALIHDHEAMSRGINRYIGRKWDANLKGWPESDPSEVAPLAEYVQAVRNGDLAPANQETADFCGVSFDYYIETETVSASTNAYTGKF